MFKTLASIKGLDMWPRYPRSFSTICGSESSTLPFVVQKVLFLAIIIHLSFISSLHNANSYQERLESPVYGEMSSQILEEEHIQNCVIFEIHKGSIGQSTPTTLAVFIQMPSLNQRWFFKCKSGNLMFLQIINIKNNYHILESVRSVFNKYNYLSQ